MAKNTRKPKAEDFDVEISTTSNADLTLEDIDLDLDLDNIEDVEELINEEELEEELDVDIDVVEDAVPKPKKTKTPKIAIPSILDDVVTMSENVEHPTWLFYGKNGTGKTTLGSTVDGALILAIEDGTLSIRDTKYDVRKLRCDSWDKIEAIYWALEGGKVTDKGIVIDTPTGKFTVTTLVFDTITKLMQTCLRSVVLGDGAADASRDVVNPTLRDWGTATQKVSYWLMMFKELPIQNVWNVQETFTGETEDDEFSIYPDVNKALRSFLLAEADIIGRTCIIKKDNEMKYAVRFGANNRYVTKDRTGKLGKTWINPRLDKMYEKVFMDKAE